MNEGKAQFFQFKLQELSLVQGIIYNEQWPNSLGFGF